MRKLLFVSVCAFALTLSAGLSFARLADRDATVDASRDGSAAVLLPAELPVRDAEHPEAYGYVSSDELARRISGADPAGDAAGDAAAAAGSATVVVTATVLPVRTIVVEGGTVTEVWSNTSDLDPSSSLYQVREGSLDGKPVALSADVWEQVRAVLLDAGEATGRIA